MDEKSGAKVDLAAILMRTNSRLAPFPAAWAGPTSFSLDTQIAAHTELGNANRVWDRCFETASAPGRNKRYPSIFEQGERRRGRRKKEATSKFVHPWHFGSTRVPPPNPAERWIDLNGDPSPVLRRFSSLILNAPLPATNEEAKDPLLRPLLSRQIMCVRLTPPLRQDVT